MVIPRSRSKSLLSKIKSPLFSFVRNNSHANYPVAIIQNGTTKNEKVIVGALENILAQKRQHQIDNPATIIFGSGVTDTVTRYKNLKSKIWVS